MGKHWYTQNGVACHEIKGANGKMRDTDLRDARKLGLLPSVTEIIKVADKPVIDNWRVDQAIMEAITQPEIAGESLEDRAKRIKKGAEAQAKAARDRGSEIHDLYTRYFHGQLGIEPEKLDHIRHLIEWERAEVGQVLWSEKILVHREYAGTADLAYVASSLGKADELIVADFKGMDLKEGKEPNTYDEWLYQLGAYAQAIEYTGVKVNGGAILIFDRSTGRIVPRYYSRAELETGIEAFNLLLRFWQLKNKYFPGRKEAA